MFLLATKNLPIFFGWINDLRSLPFSIAWKYSIPSKRAQGNKRSGEGPLNFGFTSRWVNFIRDEIFYVSLISKCFWRNLIRRVIKPRWSNVEAFKKIFWRKGMNLGFWLVKKSCNLFKITKTKYFELFGGIV